MHPVEAYLVRPFMPADAPGIATLVESVYGRDYFHDELYHPDELIRLNESKHVYSVVALNPAGSVVGHAAIMREGLGSVAETGESMVDPAHRSHHLMHRMRELLYQEAPRLGIVALRGTALANHVFSQKVYEAFAAQPCGLQLGFGPRQLERTQAQRLSTVNYFKFLTAPPSADVHAPERHRPLIERIYAQFGIAVAYRATAPLTGKGTLIAGYDSGLLYGKIMVRRGGVEIPDLIRHCRRTLCDVLGAGAVALELPLDQAGTPELCRLAEEDGFFFSSVDPLANPTGDVLRLQYLNEELDPALVQVENPFAREMLEYIVRERQRVAPP